jgi:putative DNA primase/helicase
MMQNQMARVEQAARLLDGMPLANGAASKLAGLAAHAGEWPDLQPIHDAANDEPAAFPFHGLGPVLGAAARSIAAHVQAPDALAAGSVLSTAALAAQPHADVRLPHGQASPLSLFILTSADSGDRKSATDSVAGVPVEEARREQARQFAEEMEAFKAERSGPGVDREAKKPVGKSLTIGKATVEGLHALLKSQSHIGLFTAEGAEMLGGHSMREDRRSAGLAWYLKAWSGETLDTLTRGDGLSILLGRRVAMHAMVQPILLRQLLLDPLARGQGFLARCLISEPRSLAGTRLFRRGGGGVPPEAQRFYGAIRALLQKKLPAHPGGDGLELMPRALPLSSSATALWIEFYDAIEVQQASGQALSLAKAFASKAAEQAARIAAISTMVEDPDADEVSEQTMAGAIEVAGYYLGEHLRLTGSSLEDQHLGQLRSLLSWLKQQGRTVTWDRVLQYSPASLRQLKAAGLKPLMDELIARGYLRAGRTGEFEIRERS